MNKNWTLFYATNKIIKVKEENAENSRTKTECLQHDIKPGQVQEKITYSKLLVQQDQLIYYYYYLVQLWNIGKQNDTRRQIWANRLREDSFLL